MRLRSFPIEGKVQEEAAKGATTPIQFSIQSETLVSSIPINYHDGERYPTLVRVEGTPDYLDEILMPLTAAKQKEERRTRCQRFGTDASETMRSSGRGWLMWAQTNSAPVSRSAPK
jgi:hypothetical protein